MSKRFGADKDTEKLARQAQKQGWTVRLTRGNHLMFTAPGGERIVASLTGCNTGQKKLQRTLMKAGLLTSRG